jgi:hypothetical protein
MLKEHVPGHGPYQEEGDPKFCRRFGDFLQRIEYIREFRFFVV